MTELSIKQIHILKHSLGLDRSSRSYRNHYVISEHSPSYGDILSLVESGMMYKGKSDTPGMDIFHVSDEGKQAVEEIIGKGK